MVTIFFFLLNKILTTYELYPLFRNDMVHGLGNRYIPRYVQRYVSGYAAII